VSSSRDRFVLIPEAVQTYQVWCRHDIAASINIIVQENAKSPWEKIRQVLDENISREEREKNQDLKDMITTAKKIFRYLHECPEKRTNIYIGHSEFPTFESQVVDPMEALEVLKKVHAGRQEIDESEDRQRSLLTLLDEFLGHENDNRSSAAGELCQAVKETVRFHKATDLKKFVSGPQALQNADTNVILEKMRTYQPIQVHTERFKTKTFTYPELIELKVLKPTAGDPTASYNPKRAPKALAFMLCCTPFVQEDTKYFLQFVMNLLFVFSTVKEDPDQVELKVVAPQKGSKYQSDVLLHHLFSRSDLKIKLEDAASRVGGAEVEPLDYDPTGDNVPISEKVQFNFSISNLSDLLAEFPQGDVQ